MTMDKLVVMTANIIEYFQLQGIIGIGVGGGAWILAAYAARYPQVLVEACQYRCVDTTVFL